MKPEFNKQVELVQTLLYLAEEQEKTIQYLANKTYTKSISDWFRSYRDHAAVKITKRLITEDYFFHIRPLKAVLDLENIRKDESQNLNLWANETLRFAQESDFDGFFRAQGNYYAEILTYVGSCDFDTWITYIETYFKRKPDEFHLILCPIAGNYGFRIKRQEGEASYVVRFMPVYDENGRPDGKFDYFAMGIAHEYAHCFVNPVVEANVRRLKAHRAFFEAHTNMPQSYNTDYAVINEYFVRAFQIRFMEENHYLFPAFDIPAEYGRQRKNFPYIDHFVALMRKFEHSKTTFSEFYIDNIGSIGNLSGSTG